MWYTTLPYIDVSAIQQPTQTPTTTPVFRTSTTCPIPNEWLIGAALVGLVIGYAIWGNR